MNNRNINRLPALTEFIDIEGEGLEWLHINRSEILAEAGPIAFGFQSDYTGRIDRQIHLTEVRYSTAVAYRNRWFPVHGPEAPVALVDDGAPF